MGTGIICVGCFRGCVGGIWILGCLDNFRYGGGGLRLRRRVVRNEFKKLVRNWRE